MSEDYQAPSGAGLSPAAQAVLDAVLQVSNLSSTVPVAAAALRAAALYIDDGSDGLESQDILRQIAAELEGAQ